MQSGYFNTSIRFFFLGRALDRSLSMRNALIDETSLSSKQVCPHRPVPSNARPHWPHRRRHSGKARTDSMSKKIFCTRDFCAWRGDRCAAEIVRRVHNGSDSRACTDTSNDRAEVQSPARSARHSRRSKYVHRWKPSSLSEGVTRSASFKHLAQFLCNSLRYPNYLI